MRFSYYGFSNRILFFVALVSAIVLLVSGFWLVGTQYKVRMLTVEKERAERVRHELLDAASQLSLDQASAALPKIVTERAKDMGYVPAGVTNTFLIQVKKEDIEAARLEVVK